MGEGPRRSAGGGGGGVKVSSSSPSSRSFMGVKVRYIALVLLTAQYTAFALTLHHTRTTPLTQNHPTHYLPSTTVLLSETLKLTLSLTLALYDLSKSLPPSLPATSLFSALSTAIFAGDSYKIAIPAVLYTLSNELVYVAGGNLEPAAWLVTGLMKVGVGAVVGGWLLGGGGAEREKRGKLFLGGKNWFALLFLLFGVGIVQMAVADPRDPMDDENMRLYIPQSVSEWREMGGAVANNLRKRSATYQGIEDDLLMMENSPRLDPMLGFLATVGSSLSAGFAGVYFEKVIRDSFSSTSSPTSLWVRNVQLAIYSIFPALFIGVIFLDGEKIAKNGFFEGYDAFVWAVVVLQALGGLLTAVCLRYADQKTRNLAAGMSVVLSAVGSWWCGFGGGKVSGNFLVGTAVSLASLYIYTTSTPTTSQNIFSPPPPPFITRPHRSRSVLQNNPNRPPPINLNNSSTPYSDGSPIHEEKRSGDGPEAEGNEEEYPEPKDFSIKLPTTPLISSETTGMSRPGSPVVRYSYSHSRVGSKEKEKGGYFGRQDR